LATKRIVVMEEGYAMYTTKKKKKKKQNKTKTKTNKKE
jgi:hypothetical protein